MKKTAKSIVLVDDDHDILEFLTYNLRQADYKVYTATNGEDAIALINKIEPSLVLMDIMMPGIDGIEALRLIRASRINEQPLIVLLTARSEEYSQIAGFDAGADDFITKPIRPRLLLAKIEALLRRKAVRNNNEIQTEFNDVKINREKFTVTFNGNEIQIPKKEFELLELFFSRPGKVFKRQQILSLLWGDDTIVGERTVDVHIRKLRERFGDKMIHTVKGVGYSIT